MGKKSSQHWVFLNAIIPTVGCKISKYLTETDPERGDYLIFFTYE